MQGEQFEPTRTEVKPVPPPGDKLVFDLARGLVRADGLPPRLVVPCDALSALLAAAGPEAAAAFGRAIGAAIGASAAARVSGSVAPAAPEAFRSASLDVAFDAIGREVALVGLGALELERWGRAMVLVLRGSPLGAEGDAVLEAVLASALSSAAGRDASVVLLARERDGARFLVASTAGARETRTCLESGMSWGEVLVRLHAPHASEGRA